MAEKLNPTRIHLKGQGRHEEGRAAGAVMPGMLVALTSTGEYNVHTDAGGPAERLFALEDPLQGNTIADAYAADDLMGILVAIPGDEVYAWLGVGEVAVKGSLLTSDGVGRLQVRSGTEITVAVALEAVDLNDSGDTYTRIRVRVV